MNLLTISGYSGLDPEVAIVGLTSGVDRSTNTLTCVRTSSVHRSTSNDQTMKRKTIHLFGACALLLASCTNLDPDIYSDMTIDKILEDSEQSSAYLLTPMYGQMRWFNEDRSIWDLTELGTDAWVIPTNSDGAGMTAVSGCGWTITNGNRPTPISVLVGATCGMALRPAATGCCISSKRPGWSSTSKRWRRFVPCVHSIIITCCLFSGMCRSWRPTTCQRLYADDARPERGV